MSIRSAAISLALLLLTISQVAAVPIPPQGLAQGSQYQLIFITHNTTTATSANIADYNAFIASEAVPLMGLLPPGVTFRAIASTPTTHAKDNAPNTTLPVYNTHGELVVPANFGLYSLQVGGSATLVNGIKYNQFGDLQTDLSPRTGSDVHGNRLTNATFGTANTGFGSASATNSFWIQLPAGSGIGLAAMFALSAPITFVPEPSTLTLLMSTIIFGAGAALRRRKSR